MQRDSVISMSGKKLNEVDKLIYTRSFRNQSKYSSLKQISLIYYSILEHLTFM